MTLEKETSIYQLGAIAAGIGEAVNIAESKNSIFHQATAPSTSGRKVGDIWYDSDDGFAMYKFDGTGWTQEQFGTNAISAGSVTAARLDAQDVYTNFLRVYFLSAAQAEIESLSAITANLGSVIVGGLNNEDGVITIKDASNQTIGYWDNTGINAQAGKIGDWNIIGSALIGYSNGDDVANIDPYTGIEFYEPSGLGNITIYNYGRIVAKTTHSLNQLFWELEDTITNNDTKISPGSIVCTVPSGQALVYASNIDNGNRIFIYADGSNGQAGLDSYSADGTNRPILIRANNSNDITAYGEWTFNSGGIRARNTSANAWIQAENGANVNAIAITSDSTGAVRLWSRSADGTTRTILQRANNSHAITAYGNWTFSNPIVNPSDIRLKENVKESTVNALRIINSIPMREFDWKSDGHHQAVGIIADELEKIDSGLVCGGGEDESGGIITKGIDSMYLIGYLVKAVQELSDEVKRLKGAA